MEDMTWAEEVLTTTQESANEDSKKLRALQEQKKVSEKIWTNEVSRLRGQLLVQQQWLSTITWFKLFQTATFGNFLN